jgi:hypothetical protein
MRKTRQAEMDAWQARMDAYHEKRITRMVARQAEMDVWQARREDRKTDQEKSDENMESMQARLDAWQARMDANHEMRMARRVAWLTERRNDRKETMACLEQMEARLEVEDKPASVDTTPEVAHKQEVPLEADLEKIEPNPGETEAVVERQQTSNEEVAINSPRACQNERTTCQEATKANPERMEPFDWAIAFSEQMIAMTKTNQETIATTDLKGNPEGMECKKPASVDRTPEVAREQEIPMEDTEVMPVGEPRKRRRDQRHLAAVRCQKEEQRNLDARCHGKEQDLVAARRRATRRTAVARHRILSTKDITRE